MKKIILLLAVVLANNSLHASYEVIIGVKADIKFKEAAITQPETPEIPEEAEPEPETAYNSCKDILSKDSSSTNGVYTITTGGSDVSVYCDMSGGGWTLVGVGIRNQVGNWGTTGDYNIDITPSPSPAQTYKLADGRINGINKSVYKLVTTGRYATNRYFGGSCQYSQNTDADGACVISYANEGLSQGIKVGVKTATGAGLSDYSPSGLYAISSYSGNNTIHGWGMGNGVNTAYSGTGYAGEGGNMQIWVK